MPTATRAGGQRLLLDHIAEPGSLLLRLTGRLIIQAVCLGLGVAGEVADLLLHPPAHFAGRAFEPVVHDSALLERGALNARSGPAVSVSRFSQIQAQSRLIPLQRAQATRCRKRYVGGAHVGAAEADVGGEFVRHGNLPHDLAVGGNDRNAAGMQRGDGDIAAGFDRQTVEPLETRSPAMMRPPFGDGQPCFFTTPGISDIECPEPGRFGIGDIQHLAVGREAAAIGAEDRIRDFIILEPSGNA